MVREQIMDMLKPAIEGFIVEVQAQLKIFSDKEENLESTTKEFKRQQSELNILKVELNDKHNLKQDKLASEIERYRNLSTQIDSAIAENGRMKTEIQESYKQAQLNETETEKIKDLADRNNQELRKTRKQYNDKLILLSEDDAKSKERILDIDKRESTVAVREKNTKLDAERNSKTEEKLRAEQYDLKIKWARMEMEMKRIKADGR